MIKTRLVGLLSHAKKYIVYTILWQWLALLSQVIAVFSIAGLLEKVIYGSVTSESVKRTVLTLILVVVIRFFCERMGARSSYLACVDVKRILREKIYEKIKTEIKKNRDKLFIVAGKWESAEKYNHFISNIYSDRQAKVIR